MPLDLLPIRFIVASKPAPEKSLSGLQQRSASQKRIAAPGCASPFYGQKRKRSHGVRMRPARRVHRVLLNRACDGGERIIGVAADQTNRADNEYQDYSQHHRIFRDVLALFVLPKLKGEVKHYTPFLAGVFSVWRESGCKD